MSILKFEKFMKGKKVQWIFGLLAFLSIGGIILRIIMKVAEGHGLDYFISGIGVKSNYIGALVGIVVLGLALGIGFAYSRFFYKGPKIKRRKKT